MKGSQKTFGITIIEKDNFISEYVYTIFLKIFEKNLLKGVTGGESRKVRLIFGCSKIGFK